MYSRPQTSKNEHQVSAPSTQAAVLTFRVIQPGRKNVTVTSKDVALTAGMEYSVDSGSNWVNASTISGGASGAAGETTVAANSDANSIVAGGATMQFPVNVPANATHFRILLGGGGVAIVQIDGVGLELTAP